MDGVPLPIAHRSGSVGVTLATCILIPIGPPKAGADPPDASECG